jgi:hypothetical protein
VDDAGIPALQDAIRHMHGCESTWIESVPVTEKFNGEIVWDGEVQVFDLVGHPKAKRAYAWSHATDVGKRKFLAVLQLGPVTDAITAVRVSIVGQNKSGA